MLHKRMILLAVSAAASMATACAGGGGGGGGGIVTPPPPPPPPPPAAPYVSNCATTPGALSCRTASLRIEGPGVRIAADGAIDNRPASNGDTLSYVSGDPARFEDDRYLIRNVEGVAVKRWDYGGFVAADDGLGRVRTGGHIVFDIAGNIVPGTGDGSKLTLFEITNVLNGGLDYVQLGRLSNGASNSVHTYLAFGSLTPRTVLPATGSARYVGGTRGVYRNETGVSYNTAGDITLNADFGAGRLTGSTSNMRVTTAAGAAVTPPSDLDFTASVNLYGSGYFSGVASSPTMTGSVDGAFFGEPGGAPVEIGLSYSLSGTGNRTLVGVGGLKQQ